LPFWQGQALPDREPGRRRFLEEAYAFKGGSKYLYMLFDAVPGTRGVLMPIHDLAGLPALQLETDEGFGTAF
jgi:hypothetical protein